MPHAQLAIVIVPGTEAGVDNDMDPLQRMGSARVRERAHDGADELVVLMQVRDETTQNEEIGDAPMRRGGGDVVQHTPDDLWLRRAPELEREGTQLACMWAAWGEDEKNEGQAECGG